MDINYYLERLCNDMQLRGLSSHTQRNYHRVVKRFMQSCEAPVEELTEIDVRAFLVELMRDDNLCTNSINTYNGGLRFFFAVTLNRTKNYLQMPKFEFKPEAVLDKLKRILGHDFDLCPCCGIGHLARASP